MELLIETFRFAREVSDEMVILDATARFIVRGYDQM